jgi:hypothetical protein
MVTDETAGASDQYLCLLFHSYEFSF